MIEDTDARGREVIETALARHGVEPENYVSFRTISFTAGREGNTFVFDDSNFDYYEGTMAAIAVLPYEDYLALAPDSELPMPARDEVLVYGSVPDGETVNLDGLSMRIAGRIDSFPYLSTGVASPTGHRIRRARHAGGRAIDAMQEEAYGNAASELTRVFAFDIPLSDAELAAAGDDVIAALRDAYDDSYTTAR